MFLWRVLAAVVLVAILVVVVVASALWSLLLSLSGIVVDVVVLVGVIVVLVGVGVVLVGSRCGAAAGCRGGLSPGFDGGRSNNGNSAGRVAAGASDARRGGCLQGGCVV